MSFRHHELLLMNHFMFQMAWSRRSLFVRLFVNNNYCSTLELPPALALLRQSWKAIFTPLFIDHFLTPHCYYRARHRRIGKSDTKRFWRDPYFLSQPNDNFLSICQFWQKTVLDARLDGFVWKPGDRNCSDGCMTVWHLARVSLTVCMLTWHLAPGTWHMAPHWMHCMLSLYAYSPKW